MRSSETSLRQRVQHLILDFRLDIVSQRLKAIQQQMKDAGADMDKLRPLMDNYKEMLGKMENQIMANNANTRRIVRKGEKYVRPLYTGAFIYGRFTP